SAAQYGWRLCIPHVQRESKSLPQRLAGLSQRFAVRRTFRSQKSEKRLEISRHFSRRGYASDIRSRQSFLTTSTQELGEVPYSQEALLCCIAFVLLGVSGTYVHGLFGLMCGKTMRRSRHTYLSNHSPPPTAMVRGSRFAGRTNWRNAGRRGFCR